MHLIAQQVVNDLKTLKLGEVCLFSENNKSISLIIREDNAPRLMVKLKGEAHFFSLSEKDEAQELFDKAFVITDDIYNNPKKLVEFIKSCETGVRYKFSNDKRAIEIDVESDGTFHWIYSNDWRNAYPMKNANCIQTFKTDKGARLSLIKYLGLENG
jgi:hypothetical protein